MVRLNLRSCPEGPSNVFRRVFLILAICSALFSVSAQGFSVAFGGRVNTCIGVETDSFWGVQFDSTGLCNVTAFVSTAPVPVIGALTVFTQVSPRYGPPLENWRVRAGIPSLEFNLFGLTVFHEPSVSAGRELGEWFVRYEHVFEFSFHLELPE